MKPAKSPNATSASPKYYLSDVPHNLRRRVLDLCIKRLWQDARDLLEQHGFTDYTFDDLQSFYDWAPAELPQADRSTDTLSAAPREPLPPVLDQPNRAATVRERSADSLDPSSPQQVITDDRSLPASEPSATHFPPTLPPSPSVTKSRRSSHRPRRRRSKISRLPKEIRDELNSRLENGATYTSVIEWLASKGHAGFNETNLSWWKNGGYQDWLREHERKQEARALRDWSAAIADKKDPTVLANALSNFSGAKLHRLLCALDYQSMARELQARPDVCIRYFNSAIRTGRVSLEAARVKHLVHETDPKRVPTKQELTDLTGIRL